MEEKVYKEGANAKAARGLSKIIAVMIILVVAAFGDIMYIDIMQVKFPTGIFLVLCYIGAFMSFAAIGYLLLGKTTTFRPGPQMIAAWIVFAFELVIIGLNILLAFSTGNDQFMKAWAYISPATPVLHMFGVAIIFFADPELKEKHEDMELQSKINSVERQYKFAVHEAHMDLKFKQLKFTVKALESAANSEESLAQIEQYAGDSNSALLTDLTGRAIPRMQRLSGPGVRTVSEGERDQLEQRAVAQTARSSDDSGSNVLEKLRGLLNRGSAPVAPGPVPTRQPVKRMPVRQTSNVASTRAEQRRTRFARMRNNGGTQTTTTQSSPYATPPPQPVAQPAPQPAPQPAAQNGADDPKNVVQRRGRGRPPGTGKGAMQGGNTTI